MLDLTQITSLLHDSWVAKQMASMASGSGSCTLLFGLAMVAAPNGHGNCSTPDNETCHDHFPHLSPPSEGVGQRPEGVGGKVSLREFHVNFVALARSRIGVECTLPFDRLQICFGSAKND